MFPIFTNWKTSEGREEKEEPHGRTVCAVEIIVKLFYLVFLMVLGGHSKHREGIIHFYCILCWVWEFGSKQKRQVYKILLYVCRRVWYNERYLLICASNCNAVKNSLSAYKYVSKVIYAEHLWGHKELVPEEQKRLSNLFFLLTGVLVFLKSLLRRRDKLKDADKLEEVLGL